MSESESGQSFNRTTFGGDRGEVDNGNAVTVPIETDGETTQLTLEVQQLLGDDMVRTVAMASTDGLRRGIEAKDTGRPIAVPVGKNVLGRVLDVLGQPVDEAGPVEEPEA